MLKSKAKSSNIPSIKDSIDKVTLEDYEKIIFDDDLSCLVIYGNHPLSDLLDAKNKVLDDFSQACGAKGLSHTVFSYKKIHSLRLRIRRLELCARLLPLGSQIAQDTLKDMRVMIDTSNNEVSLNRISSQIKLSVLKLREEISKYEKETKSDSSFTRDDYERQLSVVSKFIGFRIPRSISLREYSAYIYQIKKSIEDARHTKLSPTK